MPDMTPKPTPVQCEDMLAHWVQRGCHAIEEHADSFETLREEIHFSGGCLYGGLVTLGVDEDAAQVLVQRYFAEIGTYFDARWRAARAEKRCLN